MQLEVDDNVMVPEAVSVEGLTRDELIQKGERIHVAEFVYESNVIYTTKEVSKDTIDKI